MLYEVITHPDFETQQATNLRLSILSPAFEAELKLNETASLSLQAFLRSMPKKWGLEIVDRELACAPFESSEGRDYYSAMCCAANMSFANRQVRNNFV